MRYGVCTWIFGDQPLAETAKSLATMGYDGVELAGDLARYVPRDVHASLSEHGLSVLSLTPDNVDLAHPDEAVRRQAVDYCRNRGGREPLRWGGQQADLSGRQD